jgi:hypothetical protein
MEHTVAKYLDLKLECKLFTSIRERLMRVIAKCKLEQVQVETRSVTSTSQVTLPTHAST